VIAEPPRDRGNDDAVPEACGAHAAQLAIDEFVAAARLAQDEQVLGSGDRRVGHLLHGITASSFGARRRDGGSVHENCAR